MKLQEWKLSKGPKIPVFIFLKPHHDNMGYLELILRRSCNYQLGANKVFFDFFFFFLIKRVLNVDSGCEGWG